MWEQSCGLNLACGQCLHRSSVLRVLKLSSSWVVLAQLSVSATQNQSFWFGVFRWAWAWRKTHFGWVLRALILPDSCKTSLWVIPGRGVEPVDGSQSWERGWLCCGTAGSVPMQCKPSPCVFISASTLGNAWPHLQPAPIEPWSANLEPTWPVKVFLSHLVHLTWDHSKHDPDFTLSFHISRFLLTLEFSIVLELCWGVWLSTFFPPSLPFPCLLACKTQQSCWMEFTTVSMLQGLLSMQNATSKFNFISDVVASLVQPDFSCSCAWSHVGCVVVVKESLWKKITDWSGKKRFFLLYKKRSWVWNKLRNHWQ